jgi:hypothetical protein
LATVFVFLRRSAAAAYIDLRLGELPLLSPDIMFIALVWLDQFSRHECSRPTFLIVAPIILFHVEKLTLLQIDCRQKLLASLGFGPKYSQHTAGYHCHVRFVHTPRRHAFMGRLDHHADAEGV